MLEERRRPPRGAPRRFRPIEVTCTVRAAFALRARFHASLVSRGAQAKAVVTWPGPALGRATVDPVSKGPLHRLRVPFL